MVFSFVESNSIKKRGRKLYTVHCAKRDFAVPIVMMLPAALFADATNDRVKEICMRGVVLAIAFCVTLRCLAFGGAAEAATYVNGINESHPPFAYMTKAGRPAGFDVDCMDWIAQEMGFTVTHKTIVWENAIPALLEGDVDMVCSGLNIAAPGAEQVAFSVSYFSIQKLIMVGAGSPLTSEDVLTGRKKLGVQRGTTEAEWLSKNRDKNKWNYILQYYDSRAQAIAAIGEGRIDAVGIDSAPAENAIHKHWMPVKVVGEFAPMDHYGVAVRKEDVELRKKIDEGYKRLKASPYWDELKMRHFMVGN